VTHDSPPPAPSPDTPVPDGAGRSLVTCALPYANGPLHIGHLVEYIQADIWVRYRRLRGHETLFFCADDTHGTPIMIRARAEGTTPEALIERMWLEHTRDFAAFGIGFDRYHSTHSEENRELSVLIFQRLREGGYVAEREIEQPFCPVDEMFLPDRYIRGTCPFCGANDQYGDSCEVCARTYTPRDLSDAVCARCGSTPEWRRSTHLFFRLSQFEAMLREWLEAGHVQAQVANLLKEWFDAGLQDWDISRDAPYFGFEIPGLPGKYFYVWLDAPVGYMATAAAWCRENGRPFPALWNDGSYRILHFIGKDIVYFHALFWPAMLSASGFRTPDELVVHGFLTVNGEKMSKSRGTFITARTYLAHMNAQSLRFYYAAKLGSQIHDLNLRLDEFAERVNADLVNTIVNIPSRVLSILHRHCGGRLGELDNEGRALAHSVAQHCLQTGELYDRRELASVIGVLTQQARRINVYIHDHEPWRAAAEDPVRAAAVCTAALNGFRSIAIALQPVLPEWREPVARILGGAVLSWESIGEMLENRAVGPFERLAERLSPTQTEALLRAAAEEGVRPASSDKPPSAILMSERGGLIRFTFADNVRQLGVTGAYLTLTGLANRERHPEFEAWQAAVLAEVRAALDGVSLPEDPVLAGFRELHTAVGASNRKNLSSPENLLRHLLKTGTLPSVNLLVDIYNTVSVRSRLALGAHDLAAIDGNVSLRLTNGRERYLPLGAPGPEPVRAGEYAYVDDGDDIICRLEVRQVEKTKVTLGTTACFYIVQGNRSTSPATIRAATDELVDLTTRWCGGEVHILYAPWEV
jgi:methionyl-tRNA synthetase